MRVRLGSQPLTLSLQQRLGEGGEADVFDIGGGRVLKMFKQPDHPDFAHDTDVVRRVTERLEEHQRKLACFPQGLPERVVGPDELAFEESGRRVVGYAMRKVTDAEVLLRYGERSFREGVVGAQRVVDVFRDLHQTLVRVHRSGVVIGDFNDLNVLVSNTSAHAHLVDADSWQYGGYLAKVYTERFLDPLLSPDGADRPTLGRPHTEDSDWYAFAVMLMRSLLYVDPYGGVYRPKNKAQKIAQPARPLHRITVWHPEVVYPKPALPYESLPPELMHHLWRVFAEDLRVAFPMGLLDGLTWSRCPDCGLEHARIACPKCQTPHPSTVKETVSVRGTVTATRIYRTKGRIVQANVDGGKLRLLVHENGTYVREDGRVVLQGSLDPELRWRLSGDDTYVGKGPQAARLKMDGAAESFAADTSAGRSAYDVAGGHRYWVHGGTLLRSGGLLGATRLGGVLQGQTALWAGESFGIGFYRAQGMTVGFVFGPKGSAINDAVKMPPMPGQLVHVWVRLSGELAWAFFAHREQGRMVWRCLTIRPDGSIAAQCQTDDAEEAAWMAASRGAAALGDALFVPTDDGIIRMKMQGGFIIRQVSFPDTEPFVSAQSRLLSAPDGLYVVSAKEVVRLEIRP